jgi:hypothetical protein
LGARICDRKLVRTTSCIVQACGIALLWASAFVTDGFAQSLDTGWQTETRFYLTGMSNFQKDHGSSARYDNMAATAELRLISDARPWHASLFVDYRFSTDSRYANNVNLGGLVKYGWANWDATTYVFVNQSSVTPDTWLLAGRVRYRVAENHKLGIETVATFKDPGSTELLLVYYGDVSDTLSLSVAAGPGIGEVPDFNARLELTWQVM